MYKHNTQAHNLKAAKIILPILFDVYHPKSVLDVGCGLGSWIKVCQDDFNVDICGIDGPWLDKELLYVSEEKILIKDLTKEIQLNKKYNMVISLEVAEHIDQLYTHNFIKTLINHSDIILFSAAIPGQGGMNHLNEQEFNYWIDIFASHGYEAYDFVRPKIWHLDDVEWWYKQNSFLFVNKSHNQKHLFGEPITSKVTSWHPKAVFKIKNDLVVAHQEIRHLKEGKISPRQSLMIFTRSISNLLKKWINK